MRIITKFCKVFGLTLTLISSTSLHAAYTTAQKADIEQFFQKVVDFGMKIEAGDYEAQKAELASLAQYVNENKNKPGINEALINNPELAPILEIAKNFEGYQQLQSNFAECDARQFEKVGDLKGMLNAHAENETLIPLSCAMKTQYNPSETQNLSNISTELAGVTKALKQKDIVDKFYFHGLEESVNQYVRYEQQYKDKGQSDAELLKKFCEIDGKSYCDDKKKSMVKRMIADARELYPRPANRESFKDIAKGINEKIETLNKIIKADDGRKFSFHKRDITNDKAEELAKERRDEIYKEYELAMIDLASSPHGALALANNEAMGDMMIKDEFDMNEHLMDSKMFTLEVDRKHSTLSADQVQAGRDIAQERLLESILDFHKKKNDIDKDYRKYSSNPNSLPSANDELEDTMDDFLLMNPALYGKILVRNPENADLICSTLNRVEESEKSKEFWLDMADYALMATGVASLAFAPGVGTALAAAGRTMLKKFGRKTIQQAASKQYAKRKLVTVGKYEKGLYGTQVVAGLSVAGLRFEDKRQKLDQIEKAYLTSEADNERFKGDKKTLMKRAEVLSEYNDAMQALAIEGAAVGILDVGVIAARGVKNFVSNRNADKATDLLNEQWGKVQDFEEHAKAVKLLAGDPNTKLIMDTLNTKVPEVALVRTYQQLGNADAETVGKILKEVEDMKVSSKPKKNLDKIRKIFKKNGIDVAEDYEINRLAFKGFPSDPKEIEEVQSLLSAKYPDHIPPVRRASTPEAIEEAKLKSQIFHILDPNRNRKADDVVEEFNDIVANSSCKVPKS